MDFMAFCEAMENRIVMRKVKQLIKSQRYKLHITDWMIDKSLKSFEFRAHIDGLANIEDENIELLEKYVDARYEMFMRCEGTVRLL